MDKKILPRTTQTSKTRNQLSGLFIAWQSESEFEAMTELSTSCVARAILRYLRKNPNAQDTLAGIAEWWLPKQQITTAVAKVKDALVLLLAEELILEVRGKDSQSHYRINDRKWAQIETLLDSNFEVDQ